MCFVEKGQESVVHEDYTIRVSDMCGTELKYFGNCEVTEVLYQNDLISGLEYLMPQNVKFIFCDSRPILLTENKIINNFDSRLRMIFAYNSRVKVALCVLGSIVE